MELPIMDNLYSSLEEKYGLPAGLLTTVRGVESNGNSAAVSPKGARGDFQFMPDTAKAYGVDVADPVSSAHGAARYLSDLIKQYGGVQAALAHYNGGTKSGLAVAQNKDAPFEETRNYLTKVNKGLRIDPSQIQFDGEEVKPSKDEIDPSKITLDSEKSTIEPSKIKLTKPEEPTNTELFAKGLGKSVVDLGLGAKQVLDMPAQFLEKQFPAVSKFGKTMGFPTAEESAAQTNRAVEEERRASLPLMETLPGQAGYVVGNIGQMALGGAGLKAAGSALNLARPVAMGGALANPATYGAAGTVGAVQGALQPTTSEDSRLFNTLAGGTMGLAGLGIVNSLGRIAQPIQEQIGSIATNAVDTLRKAGVPLDAAQATGSRLLGRVKAALSDNPITVGAQEEFSGVQKQAYNKAIAKTMGEDATHITPEVIQTAKNRLGQIYDDVASRNSIHYDDVLNKNISNIRTEAEQVLNPTQFATIDKQIQNIISKAEGQGGGLHGEQYQAIKKVLDKLGKSTDTDVASYARELKDSLLDGLTRTAKASGNEADVKLLSQANREYGNMKKIEDVVLKNPEGDISPSLLLNSLATKGKRYSFFQDDPQLAKLASAGKIVLPEKNPNSGTVARLAAQGALTAGAAAGYGLYQGDLESAGKAAALGIAGPKLAQKAINNPAFARYLEQGLGQTQIRNMLEAPKNVGAQRLAPAAMNAYIQSLPPEQPYRVELRNMLPNRP
jgi:hypothetical protein